MPQEYTRWGWLPAEEDRLAAEVAQGEIDDRVASTTHHRLQRVQAEALRLLAGDLRRHRQLEPVADDIEQRGSFVREHLGDCGRKIAGPGYPPAVDADGVGHGAEVGIL